ncbi:MAG: polysaccharide pyruvyl transferase family protein [Lachnospiraceae bacterium]|nr:polysaccharide pyruvyl transferase family protein [Lachnospiraceae bacterium]
MKKIGILTFHKADNFGAVLQNYALQQALFSLGTEPETIDYCCEKVESSYTIWTQVKGDVSILRVLKSRAGDILNYRNAVISKKRFEDFRKKYLRISSSRFCASTIRDAKYDVYIAGSDQIWNKEIVGTEDLYAYTLAFAPHNTATFGASCGGMDCLIDDTQNLSRIEIVTVRESELCDELKKRGIKCQVVCDPVFLLKREQWIALIENMPKRKKRHIFLYYIDSGRDNAAMIANEISKKLGVKVHYPKRYDMKTIKNHYGINVFSDGPLEFIAEISGADFIVSSSFHGIAFSILMEKEFVAVLHEKTGDRVRNLLEYLGLNERIVVDLNDFKNRSTYWKPIDYKSVKVKLEKWKEESIGYLREMSEL